MRKKIIQTVLWGVAIIYCLPFVVLARYSALWADDFSNWFWYLASEGGSHLSRCLDYNDFVYNNWQGAYAANFFSAFLHPLYWHQSVGIGLSTVTRLINTGVVVLLFISIYLFLRSALPYIGIEKERTIAAFSLIVIPLLSARHYSEIFSWCTVVVEYTLFLSFAFFSIFFFLKQKKSVFTYVLAFVLAFLASGGILIVSGVMTYFALMLLILKWVENRKPSLENVCYFFVPLVGSLFNALANGNFERHAIIDDGGLSFFGFVYFSIKVTLQGIYNFIVKGNAAFTLFVLIAFFAGFLQKKVISRKRAICIIIALSLWPVVAVFPDLLGYNATDISILTIRVAFIFNLILFISIEAITYLMGTIIGNGAVDEKINNDLILMGGVLLIYVVFTKIPAVETQPYFQLCDAIVSGELKESSDSVYNVYKILEDSDDEVVVLEAPRLIEWFVITPFSDNSEDWVNVALRRCYDKQAVRFITEEK